MNDHFSTIYKFSYDAIYLPCSVVLAVIQWICCIRFPLYCYQAFHKILHYIIIVTRHSIKVYVISLQWNPTRAMPWCSSVFIPMQRLTRTACMGVVQLLKVRNGQQPSGFMSDPLRNRWSKQEVGNVSMKMRAALCGQRRVSVKRTLFIWWVQRGLMVIVGRAVRYAHPRKPLSFRFFVIWKWKGSYLNTVDNSGPCCLCTCMRHILNLVEQSFVHSQFKCQKCKFQSKFYEIHGVDRVLWVYSSKCFTWHVDRVQGCSMCLH